VNVAGLVAVQLVVASATVGFVMKGLFGTLLRWVNGAEGVDSGRWGVEETQSPDDTHLTPCEI